MTSLISLFTWALSVAAVVWASLPDCSASKFANRSNPGRSDQIAAAAAVRSPSFWLVPGGKSLRQGPGVAFDECRGLRDIVVVRGIIPVIDRVFQRIGHPVEDHPPGLHDLSSTHRERNPGTQHGAQGNGGQAGRAKSNHNITMFMSG